MQTESSALLVTPPDAITNPPIEFARRVVRFVAIVCLAHAALQLLTFGIYVVDSGWRAFGPYAGASTTWQTRSYIAISVSALACQIAVGVSAVAMLAWKRWARLGLIISEICSLSMSFVAMFIWMAIYSNAMAAQRSTTRAYQPSVLVMLGSYALSYFDRAIFPILVLLILLQPDVARLWANPAQGAFEVLPLPVGSAADESHLG